MNDYILTTALMLMGVSYHVMGVVSKQRKKYPELGFKSIWVNFFNQEWDSLIVSGLGIFVYEMLLYISVVNQIKLPDWLDDFGMYVIAILWGYAGQRVAYKILNTGEAVLEKKVEQLKQ